MSWVSIGVAGGSALLGAAGTGKEHRRQARAEGIANATAEGERGRDRLIGITRGQIDNAFDAPGRQQQYATYANALRGYLGEQLGRKKLDTSRQLKFALAKGGQVGGSVGVDANRRLGDEFMQASLGNERQVQQSTNALMNQDEQSRNALKAMAGQGMNVTTAGRRATDVIQQNMEAAGVDARVKGLGDVFKDTAGTYRAINERDALRAGYAQRRADLYGRGR